MADKQYDVIIIGGGPAGLTAGLYASRARLKSLLIEKAGVGGWMVNAGLVENYPGFPQGIGGLELADLIDEQAKKYGLEVLLAEVAGLELKEGKKIVETTEGNFAAKAVIIANGSDRVKLNVPGEEEFTGRGVAYCAICDGALFRDKPVAVVGGGNVAISEALDLVKFASKVVVIHRRQQLRATRILQERAFDEPKNIVVLPYISMHDSTREMVKFLVEALAQRGITVKRFDLTVTDIGKLAMSLVDAATVILGTPTVLAGPHPNVAYAAFLANALRPNIKFASIIGSYGWGGKTVEVLTGLLPNLKVEVLEPVLCKGYPRETDFKALDTLAKTIAQKHKQNNFA